MKGEYYKRIRYHAKGKAGRMVRKHSHIRITLEEGELKMSKRQNKTSAERVKHIEEIKDKKKVVKGPIIEFE